MNAGVPPERENLKIRLAGIGELDSIDDGYAFRLVAVNCEQASYLWPF
jgi:hypothetical protein